MASGEPIADLTVADSATVREALEVLDRGGRGFLLVVDDTGVLVGLLTDGDVRRALLRGDTPDAAVAQAMQRDFASLRVGADNAAINRVLDDRIRFVPLVDDVGRPVDYASHTRHRRFPVAEPLLTGNEADYLLECVRSGWISSQGPYVAAFEEAVRAFHDVSFALSTSNGTTALHLALVALQIGPGDEVIVPDFTFAATAATVVHAGATPVFVDVDPHTWTMDPDAAFAAVTPRTRALIPVHLYGHPCDPRLIDGARERGLLVVEDVAEAFGARVGGRLVGTLGDVAAFSFFGNKTLTTGEGGMLLFRDEEVARRATILRDHGMQPGRRYWHLEPGFNYRLTNLQAAVGVAQMERLDEILERKRMLAKRYDAAFASTDGLALPPRAPWAEPVCWLYTMLVDDELGLDRDELAERLLRTGVETRPVFLPLHEMPAYATYARDVSFPVAEELARTGISLPSAVTLTDDEIDAIARRIRSIVDVRRLQIASGDRA